MNMESIYVYEGFGEAISFAESLGFVDDEDDWNAEIADGLEEEAIEFIEKKGYKVIWEDN